MYISLYGLKLYRSEYGSKFREALEQFEKMQFYSDAEIAEYQNERLSSLIEHCYRYVPYYRKVMDDRKLTPADIRTTEDLHKLPVLTKDDIRRHSPDLRAQNISP